MPRLSLTRLLCCSENRTCELRISIKAGIRRGIVSDSSRGLRAHAEAEETKPHDERSSMSKLRVRKHPSCILSWVGDDKDIYFKENSGPSSWSASHRLDHMTGTGASRLLAAALGLETIERRQLKLHDDTQPMQSATKRAILAGQQCNTVYPPPNAEPSTQAHLCQ